MPPSIEKLPPEKPVTHNTTINSTHMTTTFEGWYEGEDASKSDEDGVQGAQDPWARECGLGKEKKNNS